MKTPYTQSKSDVFISNHSEYLKSFYMFKFQSIFFVILVFQTAAIGCNSATQGTHSTLSTSTDATQVDDDLDGYTVAEGDCDDFDPTVNPAATEVPCDGIDNDCANGDLNDYDGDGYTCDDLGGSDCDDSDPSVHPDAADACYDGVDSNCDQSNDDDCDQDGYSATSAGGDDCDDTDPSVNPGQKEVCWDGVNNDCDAKSPDCDCDGDGYDADACGGDDCDDTEASINPGEADVCYDGLDTDCDGQNDFDCDGDGYSSDEHDGGGDCNDADAAISPGEPDICGDKIDNDCDPGTSDCDCDGDGHDDTTCGGDDCDDADADIYPGAIETIADGLNNDCDEEIDEDAYCNRYAPLSNPVGAERDYLTFAYDALTYTESVTIDSYDAATGDANLSRSMVAATTREVTEFLNCTAGLLTMSGFNLTDPTLEGDFMYSDDRTVLLPEDEMFVGANWSYSYSVTSVGMETWQASGLKTVVAIEDITISAGTFEALVIENDYEILDSLNLGNDRVGTVTDYLVRNLGIVFSIDVDSLGNTVETREMTTYLDYFPE